MLLLLRSRAHEVHSGVAVARGKELAIRHAVTTVRMRAFGEEEPEAYVGLGEGVGKAGGYAIQGRAVGELLQQARPLASVNADARDREIAKPFWQL